MYKSFTRDIKIKKDSMSEELKMVRKIICTKPIIDYAEKVAYLINDCEIKDDLEEEFLTSVCDDTKIRDAFFNVIPSIKEKMVKDLEFFMESDPAADSEEQIIFAYPGYKAIVYYRIAHELHKLGLKFEARVITEHAHFLTGIDIHPAATIGSPFFIDHGTGIVIGETSIVGDYVKLYQGVTLGALSLGKGAKLKGVKRHPTIGNHVTIYSNASILGGDVVIGNNVIIGSNVFLLKSIEDNHRVTIQEPDLVLIKKL